MAAFGWGVPLFVFKWVAPVAVAVVKVFPFALWLKLADVA